MRGGAENCSDKAGCRAVKGFLAPKLLWIEMYQASYKLEQRCVDCLAMATVIEGSNDFKEKG